MSIAGNDYALADRALISALGDINRNAAQQAAFRMVAPAIAAGDVPGVMRARDDIESAVVMRLSVGRQFDTALRPGQSIYDQIGSVDVFLEGVRGQIVNHPQQTMQQMLVNAAVAEIAASEAVQNPGGETLLRRQINAMGAMDIDHDVAEAMAISAFQEAAQRNAQPAASPDVPGQSQAPDAPEHSEAENPAQQAARGIASRLRLHGRQEEASPGDATQASSAARRIPKLGRRNRQPGSLGS